MFVVTHALSPVAGIAAADALRLEATGERLFRREHYIAFALSGALPDVLCPHLSLAARYASWSHTFWALCLFAAIALPAARFLFGSRRWLLAGSLMVFAYAFHLGCDAVAGGIKWNYPFSDHLLKARWVPYACWIWLDIGFTAAVATLGWWLRRRARAKADLPAA